jgi:glutaredoxin
MLGLLVFKMDVPGGALLAVGLFAGAILCLILQQKHFLDWWPVSREITDWNKVESLLADAPTAPVVYMWRRKWRQWVLLFALIFAILLGLTVGGQHALAFTHDPRRGNPADSVVILTAPWCGHCMVLRETLAKNRIPYTDIDVEKSAQGRWAFAALRGTGVPITVVGDQIVRGTDWYRIESLLHEAGFRDFRSPVADAVAESALLPR